MIAYPWPKFTNILSLINLVMPNKQQLLCEYLSFVETRRVPKYMRYLQQFNTLRNVRGRKFGSVLQKGNACMIRSNLSMNKGREEGYNVSNFAIKVIEEINGLVKMSDFLQNKVILC